MAAWQVFDYRNVGYLDQQEFTQFMFSYIGSGSADRREVINMFLRHDIDHDGRINYAEFCRMLVPKINQRL